MLLTALGPGPRLWERRPDHPEALVVRLGTTDRAEVPSVPVTVGLREAGSLGLAGPRARLAGLARATVAQLAALHSPLDLEIVLISTDRSRTPEERRREWSWLGWLPHLRPTHGQDCSLLAYEREQAEARAAELVRRLDEGPLGPGWPHLDRATLAEAARAHTGPHTVVVLDGDPGTAFLRETTARLAGAARRRQIHLICLAETPAASPHLPGGRDVRGGLPGVHSVPGVRGGRDAERGRGHGAAPAAHGGRAGRRARHGGGGRRGVGGLGRAVRAGVGAAARGGLGRAGGPSDDGRAAAVRPAAGRAGPGPRHPGLP